MVNGFYRITEYPIEARYRKLSDLVVFDGYRAVDTAHSIQGSPIGI
jgi:hypothetical protein